MTSEQAEREAAAQTFADWAHVQGYTNNPQITRAALEAMARAWIAGVMYGLGRALEMTYEPRR